MINREVVAEENIDFNEQESGQKFIKRFKRMEEEEKKWKLK